MIEHPFAILRAYKDRLHVAIMAKQDAIGSDDDIRTHVPDIPIARLWQAHGKETVIVREPTSRTIKADGMLTDQPGLLLTIRWADCQNFVVYAPKKHVIGLLHAGWRGLEAGAIESFFATLKREWGIEPEDTIIGAGPSLGFECANFTDPSKEMPSMPKHLIDGKKANLQQAATDRLLALGVKADRIERIPDCTTCHSKTYWTYRGGDREAVIAGKTNVLCVRLF